MKFRVFVTANAKQDLRSYYELAAERAPHTAEKWLTRFELAINSLDSNPDRCPVAPENDAVTPQIHQLIFGKRSGAYRVLFTISDADVRVLHIRRATMGTATSEDLK